MASGLPAFRHKRKSSAVANNPAKRYNVSSLKGKQRPDRHVPGGPNTKKRRTGAYYDQNGQDSGSDVDEGSTEADEQEQIFEKQDYALGSGSLETPGTHDTTQSQPPENASSDDPQCILLKDWKDQMNGLDDVLSVLLDIAKNASLARAVPYLCAKSELVIGYLINLCFVLLLIAEGRQIDDHPVLARLIQSRMLFRRLKPVDVRAGEVVRATLRGLEGNESTIYRANLGVMIDSSDADEVASKLYRPPKMIARRSASKYLENDMDRKLEWATGGDDESSDSADFGSDDPDSKMKDDFEDLCTWSDRIIEKHGNGDAENTAPENCWDSDGDASASANDEGDNAADASDDNNDRTSFSQRKNHLDWDAIDDSSVESVKPSDDNVSLDDQEEDPLYIKTLLSAKNRKEGRLAQRCKKRENPEAETEPAAEQSSRRAIHRSMESRVIKPSRSKMQTAIPRVRHRTKYAKTLKKLKGRRPSDRDPGMKYHGESSGINKAVVKSRVAYH